MAFAPKPKPRGENESDAAYNKRVADWTRSQERLKSVGITTGVNKASKEQLDAFTKKYGHAPSGLKPKEDKSKEPVDTAPNNQPPTMGDKNSAPKPGGRQQGGIQRGKDQAGMTANGGSAQSTGGFGGPIGAMGAMAGSTPAGQAARQGLSQMVRRKRRAMRQSIRRMG